MRPLSRVVADFAAGFLLVGAACHTHGQGAVAPEPVSWGRPRVTPGRDAAGPMFAGCGATAAREQEFLPAVSALESSAPSLPFSGTIAAESDPRPQVAADVSPRPRTLAGFPLRAIEGAAQATSNGSVAQGTPARPVDRGLVGVEDPQGEHRTKSGDGGSTPPASTPLTIELRIGGLVVFGDGAPAGTAPFADLRTTTRLAKTERPWRLTTQTQLSAAPGSEFDVASADTWQTLDFALGLAVPLRAAWNVSGLATCGVQARVFQADAIDPPAARRCGMGILVESTSAAHLSLVLAYDERLHGWGALVGASVDVAPSLGFVGSALVGRSSVTLKLAAVVLWTPKGRP